MNTSSISVVIPNYNHSKYIQRQLDALTSQTVPPLEVIVIDDASTDDSVAFVERYARSNPIVRLIRNERNLGVVGTLNRGLQETRGEFFYGGAADDRVEPRLIEATEGMIRRYPDAGIYFGMYRAIDPDDREICIEGSSRWHEEMHATPEAYLNEYLEAEHCSHSLGAATVYRKCCMEEVGGYRKELGHWSDTFMPRAIGLKYGAGYTPEVLATMRRLPGGFSGTQARDARLMLDIVARSAWLMRSPEFRDRFPSVHVDRWEKGYREYVIWGHLYSTHQPLVRDLSASVPEGPGGNKSGEAKKPWPRRLWARLLLSYHWRRLHDYVPDLSCYSATSRRPRRHGAAPSA